jgi:hypothetical protein
MGPSVASSTPTPVLAKRVRDAKPLCNVLSAPAVPATIYFRPPEALSGRYTWCLLEVAGPCISAA